MGACAACAFSVIAFGGPYLDDPLHPHPPNADYSPTNLGSSPSSASLPFRRFAFSHFFIFTIAA
jgi:hypothetical protein